MKPNFIPVIIGLIFILVGHSVAIYDLQKAAKDGALFTSGTTFAGTLTPEGTIDPEDSSKPPAHDQIVGWKLFQINDPVPDVVERVPDGTCVFVSKALVVWYRDSGAWVWPYLTANDGHVMHCWGNKPGQNSVELWGLPTHWVGIDVDRASSFRFGGNL